MAKWTQLLDRGRLTDRQVTDKFKFEVFGWQRFSQGINWSDAGVKYGGGSVMVWGGFGNGEVGNLFRMKRDLEERRLSLYFSMLCHTLWMNIGNYLWKKQWPGIMFTLERPAKSMEPIQLLCKQLDYLMDKKFSSWRFLYGPPEQTDS